MDSTYGLADVKWKLEVQGYVFFESTLAGKG